MKSCASSLKPVALAISLALSISGCGGKSADEHLLAGKQLVSKGETKAAVLELKSAVQMQPENSEARLILGKALFSSYDYVHAEKELLKARELGAPAEELLPLLGKIWQQTGEYQKVLDAIKPVPTLTPETAAAIYAARARALISLNRINEARQQLAEGERSALKIDDIKLVKAILLVVDKADAQAIALLDAVIASDPKKVEAYYLKASILLNQGKNDEAKALFERVIKIEPTQIVAHSAVATMLLSSGDIKSADSAIKQAESSIPGNLMVHYLRAWVDFSQGRYKEARDAIGKVLAKSSGHLQSQLLFAAVSFELADFEQARKYAELAYAGLPNNLYAGRLAISSLIKLHEGKAAIALLPPLLAKHGNDPVLLILAGDAHALLKEYDKALDFLEKAQAIAPGNDSIKVRLANVMVAQGQPAKAIDLLTQVNKSQKTSIESDKTLIMLLLGQKQYDQALQVLDSLAKKSPNSASIQAFRAFAYQGKNDLPAARKALEQALVLDPAYFPAVKHLVELDRGTKNYAAARKRLEGFLTKDAKNAEAMFELAGLAYLEKQEKSYVGWLEKVIAAQPSYLQAYALLVNFNLAKKEPQKALSFARTAVSSNPENPNALRLLGVTQSALNDHRAAVSTFMRMTEKDPQSAAALDFLARAQVAAGEVGAAKKSLEKALQIQPGFVDALESLFKLEIKAGANDKALQLAARIQREQPNAVTGYNHEADALMMLGRTEQAIKSYEVAMSKGGGSVVLAKLYKALLLAGKEKLASQRVAEWLAKHPEDLLIRSTIADNHLANKRYREAVTQYEEVLRLLGTTQSIAVLNNLAYAYQQEKDPRALPTAERVYKLAPQSQTVLDTYGWILAEQGRAKDALPLLRSALDKMPEAKSTRYHYAVALFRSGQKAEAKKEIQILLQGKAFPELELAKAIAAQL